MSVSLICRDSSCYNHSTYGYADTDEYNYCAKHKFPGMVKLEYFNNCIIENCENKAVYGKTNATHCIRHKIETFKKPTKYCKYDNCVRYANYGTKESNKREYCCDHKNDTMIIIYRKICISLNCIKSALYGYETMDYCKDHKSEDMNYLKKIKCKTINCPISASYGYAASKQREYCNEHKKENMINVLKTKCIHEECTNNAAYGYRDINKKQYCNEHKKEKMFNLERKKCKYDKCQKYASFGLDKKQYCIDHKDDHMIFINKRKCKFDGCDISPSYGEPGTKSRLYCTRHKGHGMIRLH